jgi:glycosyltransferase involved in cell wall biosynthesis
MRIAYVTPALHVAGGMERVLTVKANYLAETCGYDVYIIITDGAGQAPYYPLSDKVHLINLNLAFDDIYRHAFLMKTLLYLIKMRRYKKMLASTLCGIKPDITVSLLRRDINFICDINDGSKKIGEIHNNRKNYRNFEQGDTSWLKELFAKYWMYKLVKQLKRLDAFVVLSDEDKENWVELDNVRVINNPVSSECGSVSTCDEKRVIAVGRYAYQKGFDMLIDAWKYVAEKHPDWCLDVYGAGDSAPYLSRAEMNGIADTCRLHGATKDITAEYCRSSIFVLSSRFEGFPMVLPEAMSCGLPCVAFTCPCGTKDIIADGVNGIWVEAGNVEQLADKICYLIEHPAERKQMGIKAAHDIRRLSIGNIMHRWTDLFDKMV